MLAAILLALLSAVCALLRFKLFVVLEVSIVASEDPRVTLSPIRYHTDESVPALWDDMVTSGSPITRPTIV